MGNIVLNGTTRIWTEIRGHSRLGYALLCSGGPGCCDYLAPVAEMIEDGYAVVRFEQRGCGRSDSDGRYDLPTVLDDMEAIRTFYGIDTWVVAGHSWGANLSLAYALAHPGKVDALIYIAGNGVQRNREWSAEYHANRDKHGEAMPPMRFEGNDQVNRVCNQSWQAYIQRPTLYRDIADLRVRTLILCATNDVRPNWPAEQLQALMPNARLVFIQGAAHYIWLTHSAELRKEMRAFLGLAV